MPNFMTVSINCRNDQVRQAFEVTLAAHREFLLKQSRATGIADVCIIELDDSKPERTFTDIKNVLAAAPHTEIVLTATRTDPQLLLETIRLGVKEFLPQPIQQQDLEQALERIKLRAAARDQSEEKNIGKVFSVIGGKGGVGTSTVALNLATSLQKAGRQSVVLVDLDLQGDDLALFLDLAATQGIRELAQDMSRLDQTILQSMLVKHKSGVHLLSSGYHDVGEALLPPGCIMHTIGLLRMMFGCVVLDCGDRLNAGIQEALDLSSHILVVTTLGVPPIRRAKRLVQHLQHSVAGRTRVFLVINRYRSADVELLKEAENILKLKASWLIGNDYRTTSQALDAGVPVADFSPHAEVSQQYGRQAVALLKEMAPPAVAGSTSDRLKKGSRFSKYWPLFSNGKAKTQIV